MTICNSGVVKVIKSGFLVFSFPVVLTGSARACVSDSGSVVFSFLIESGSIERKNSFLFSSKWVNISGSCPCKRLFTSWPSGIFTADSFTFGRSFKNSCRYFCAASPPALSPSKKKMISSRFCSSLIACKCSPLSPFVP